MKNDQILNTCNWWYMKDGKSIGPHNEPEINELIHLGEIVRKTPVWYTGMQNWCDADTSEVRSAFGMTASVKANRVNNRFAWALAIVPYTVYAFVELLLMIFKPELAGTSIVFLICVLLNLILWGLDQDNLTKSGYRLSAWMCSWMWVVPVYLFVRAHKTGKKYGYAICCIVPSILVVLFFFFNSIF